jgi:para-aminobenzoate synthetase component 1
VFDSDPADEYDETLQKGQTLMEVFKTDAIDSHSSKSEDITWFNGAFMPTAEAGISVQDEGLLYGYGFFETIRANDGRPHLLEAHLARFNTTWTRLFSDPPPDLSWAEIIRQVLRRNRLTHTTATVKILATMGENTGPSSPHNLLVLAREYRHRLKDRPDSGFRLITYPHPR